jgi:N6-adenosine-specific RNA methylase IME4
MKELINQEWYQSLTEDCKAIIKEAVFTSRWALVEGYWKLGERIETDEDFKKFSKGNHSSLQDLANNLNTSERTIYYARQAYNKFPQLGDMPEGKNLTWNKLITKYLPEPKKEKQIPLPDGKYQVIYADPPWKYDVDLSSGSTREPENNYPTMDLDDLIKFGEKVKEISNKDCVLFMWITAPKLNWMMDVLSAWDFEYKTNLIWDKIKPNMGHYSSVRHEILIIAGKGKCAPTCDGKTIQSVDSVQSIEKSSRHSEKPHEFYSIIEKLYPEHKKIELFARNKKDGWDVWGNQV